MHKVNNKSDSRIKRVIVPIKKVIVEIKLVMFLNNKSDNNNKICDSWN
jgi:hypothetical protein